MEDLTASAIYAGILLARRVPGSTEARRLEAVRVSVGPADEGAYDYQGAEALILRFGDAFFSSRENDTVAFRETLMNYVLGGGAGWPDLLPAGRRVVVRSLTPNAHQCFEIARLLDGHDPDTVSWWDACAAAVRLRRSDALANDGREAERLSLQAETDYLKESNLKPIWMALEDNGFGCDIQSFRPGPDGWDDPRTHFIEVKSTVGRRRFYISRNEWSFASRHSDSWELQFWDMRTGRLQSLSFAELVDHMPRNFGSGEWMSAMISTEGLDA